MLDQLDLSLWPLALGLFGFGGGGGIGGFFKSVGGARGVLGGLSLLGSALLEHQEGKENKRAAKEEERRLRREARATRLEQQAAARQREEEARQEAGALAATLASRGLSLQGGAPRDMINLLARRRKTEEDEQQQLDALERAGLSSAIRSAKRTAGHAGFMSLFRPGVSLLGNFARF